MNPFEYDLPAERIAQRPVRPYDSARLLAVRRSDETLTATTFAALTDYLRAGDLLVFNDTKVIPARLFGRLEGSGGEIEVLLLEEENRHTWFCTGKPLKKFKPGAGLDFGAGLRGVVGERVGERNVTVAFLTDSSNSSVTQRLSERGVMPIPPYIRGGRGDESDRSDYQTHFAKVDGSVAAPTASLHFTESLVSRIRAMGVEIEFVTLHVGAPSFTMLWGEGDKEIIPPGKERYVFDLRIKERILSVRSQGGRIVAVGTTVVRALESMMRFEGSPGETEETALFIAPGFEFKAVDVLVTNFHQPRSTHLLLVESFLGRARLESSYRYALEKGFRFLSYGDGMIINH